MLERMDLFFENRLDGYDEHMMTNIESAEEFYPFTAQLLPKQEKSHVLDLGCGTGLELEQYFQLCPSAKITGIDLSKGMLEALEKKFSGKDITLIQGSYFNVPLGEEVFDAAVSVESLHHFTKEEKLPLYTKLCAALKEEGYFILTDYFAPSEELEKQYRQDLLNLKAAQGINDDEFYHYDTPLTVEHETEALREAGFTSVEVLDHWGATYTIKASKRRNMTEYRFITLREKPQQMLTAAEWFHSKWRVPKEAYIECMEAYLNKETEYGWYLCYDGDKLIGGLGVIENDFHDRKDLTPNVCAVYTEESYRKQGIAGRLLNMAVEDLRAKGVSPVYLVTDHTGFYERYGWEFLCMVQGDGEPDLTRMYIHR